MWKRVEKYVLETYQKEQIAILGIEKKNIYKEDVLECCLHRNCTQYGEEYVIEDTVQGDRLRNISMLLTRYIKKE